MEGWRNEYGKVRKDRWRDGMSGGGMENIAGVMRNGKTESAGVLESLTEGCKHVARKEGQKQKGCWNTENSD